MTIDQYFYHIYKTTILKYSCNLKAQGTRRSYTLCFIDLWSSCVFMELKRKYIIWSEFFCKI